MKQGRSSKRRRQGPFQPSLPGLTNTPDLRRGVRGLMNPMPSAGDYALERARTRLPVVFCCFLLMFFVVSGRLADLSLFGAEPDPRAGQVASSGEMAVTSRADITDRNGTVLATSLPTVTLIADAKKVLDPDEAAHKLASVLPQMDAKKTAEELHNARRYVTLYRHLTPRQYYEINKMGIAGLEYTPDEARIYPNGSLTSHVVGYTDIDNNGIAGLEKTLNSRLQSAPTPVATSIDLRLQTIMRGELARAVDTYHALGGAGIIMDITTGEILSLVSLPDFDPQKAGEADGDTKFNRATLGVYEMGSTFKTFNTAMAIDSGQIKVSDRFDTTHNIQIGHQTIRDYHPSSHPMNVAEILMVSSNIGSARMVEKLGTAHQKAFLKNLGLLDKANIELPEIGAPIVPSAANWGETTTMTISFGHGLAVSAVQLVGAATSVLYDGKKIEPTLLKATAPLPDDRPRVVSPKTVTAMRALMRLVVKAGTGKKADVAGYLVAGKTGTADKLNGHHYSENARMSSFLSIFPANAPRYLVYALLDDPKGTPQTYGFATGGWTAAPVVSHVIGQIAPLLGMPPVDEDVQEAHERQLLKTLGNDVLTSLNINTDDDYASVESNDAR